MRFSKRLLAALCLVLCLASAGWCAEPFKANKGGFGPKIKGVQLGMKMSLMDLVLLGASFEDRFEMFGRNGDSSFAIYFKGEGQKIKSFEVDKEETGGVYARCRIIQKLGDVLAEIEKIGFSSVVLLRRSYVRGINVKINKDMRVESMQFEKNYFGAGHMEPQEFAQAITDAYHIPGMDWKWQRKEWEYRNSSERWGITCNEDCTVKVFHIIVESKFD